jgi:hypothetical protein
MTPMVMMIPGTMTREDRHRRSETNAEDRWIDISARHLLKNQLSVKGIQMQVEV